MAVNMTDGCGSSAEFEPYSHFAHQSPQLDFSSLSSHDISRDHHAPALYSSVFSDDLPSLGLTGDTSEPRKRIRGERIVWTPEEDEFLRRAVHIYGDKTEKWAKIAACVPGRTNKNCRKRWFHSLDPSLRKGGWTEEEDHLLRTGVQKFRGQWSKIAERIQGRTDDQCAKRWRESLDPEIDRAAWTPEDDMLLLRKFEEFGTQWQRIALSFPGRPGLHCRNRWRKIQRSLSHSERASKRRRNQFNSLDGHLASSSSKASEPVNRHHEESAKATAMSPEDALMQESFLDDKFDLLEGNDDLTDDRNDSNPDEERPYGCAVPDCKFESSSPSLLFYHFKASHHGTTVLKPFRCTMPGCEGRKRYKNINGLQYHVAHAKSTAGHSGHGNAQQDGQQESTSPSGTSAEDSPKPTSNGDYHIPYPTPGSIGDSTSFPPIALPTPAEIQSRFQSALSQPIITRHAFNIPHTPETREGSLIPSPLSLDTPLPQSYSPSLQCPELGCGHIFQALPRLTAHMASNHGHQSMAMTMESNEPTIGSEAIAIPESDFGDIDIDLNFLSQDDTSPMDTNMLLMEDLQPQFSRMERNRETFFLNSMSLQVLTASTMGSTQDMDILSMKELLFANHIVSSLNNISLLNNRIHFGTHINVRADYTPTLPSTPVTSANVSPRMTAVNIPSDVAIPSAMAAERVSEGPPATSAMAGRFPCLAADCPKTYGSNSAMRAHFRHDHSSIYTKSSKVQNPSRKEPLRAAGTAMDASPSPIAVATLGFPNSPAPTALNGPRTASQRSGSESMLVNQHFSSQQQQNQQQQPQQGSRRLEEVADKPFKCLVSGCGKGYMNINGLKNHLLQAHGSMPKKSTASVATF